MLIESNSQIVPLIPPRTTLVTSVVFTELIGNQENYTRNEWRRCETTLGTSGEDVKNTLETSG
jgi:hypothetical protein